MERCDKEFARIFGGSGAVAFTALDYNGLYRGRDPRRVANINRSTRYGDPSKGDVAGNKYFDEEHLYNFPHMSGNKAATENTEVYVPPDFDGQPTKPTPSDAVVTFFYKKLGNETNVTLAIFHVANFAVKLGVKNAAGSIRIGRTGGPGGDTGGAKPNRHAHFELWKGKTGFLPPGAKRDAARIPLTPVICS